MKKSVRDKAQGMTLIELLVVVGLMTLLISIAAPALRPMGEERMLREATRGVQGALESAQLRAARLGRSCGVALIPYKDFPSVSVVCEQVTCPQDFCGVNVNSTCTIQSATQNSRSVTLSLSFSGEDVGNFQAGDRIQLGGSGAWYKIISAGASSKVESIPTAIASSGGKPIPQKAGSALPFRVQRQPKPVSNDAFARALGADPPFTLPRGSVVDLYYSGVGLEDGTQNFIKKQWSNTGLNPIIVLFSPTGEVSIYSGGNIYPIPRAIPKDPGPKVYLLVGEWGRGLRSVSHPDGLDNLGVASSFWVVVNGQTGLVTSNVNVAQSGGDVVAARKLAKVQKSALGGR